MVRTERYFANRLAALVVMAGAIGSPSVPGALAQAKLKDAPIVWFENDRNDIPKPEERDPNLRWDYINDSVVLPTYRFTNFVRITRRTTGFPFKSVSSIKSANAMMSTRSRTMRRGFSGSDGTVRVTRPVRVVTSRSSE